jgi:hypothetical protein
MPVHSIECLNYILFLLILGILYITGFHSFPVTHIKSEFRYKYREVLLVTEEGNIVEYDILQRHFTVSGNRTSRISLVRMSYEFHFSTGILHLWLVLTGSMLRNRYLVWKQWYLHYKHKARLVISYQRKLLVI